MKTFQLNFTYNIFLEHSSSSNNLSTASDQRNRFADLENEGFIILATSQNRFQVHRPALWRRNGHYLVLLLLPSPTTVIADAAQPDKKQREERDSEEDDLVAISTWLQEMWTAIGSVTVMTIFRGHLWTYQPFKPASAAAAVNGSYGRIEMFTTGNNGNNNKRQVTRNLHGYPLRLELFESGYYLPVKVPLENGTKRIQHFVGPDKETIDVLQGKMNFTAVLQQPDSIDQYGSKLPNGTFTGCLGRIVYKQSDLVAIGFFIKDYLTEELEFTVGIYPDELCCVTKKAQRIPQYLLPTICFQWQVWLLIFLTIPASTLIWILLRELAIRNNHRDWQLSTRRDYLQLLVDSGIIMLSSPMRKFPKGGVERAFVASLCLVSLIFVSIFQSSLSTAFIRPFYYKDINTLQDLARSDMRIGIKYPAMMDDLFPPGSTGIIKTLREMMILTNSTANIMDNVATGGKLVAVTRKELTMQSYSKYFAARRVHLVPECPRTYNLGFFGPKNSVFMERVNEVLLQLNNGGFHVKWIRDYHYNYSWMSLKMHGNYEEDTFKVLTMEDLQLPFFILGTGAVISAVVLVLEYFAGCDRGGVDRI